MCITCFYFHIHYSVCSPPKFHLSPFSWPLLRIFHTPKPVPHTDHVRSPTFLHQAESPFPVSSANVKDKPGSSWREGRYLQKHSERQRSPNFSLTAYTQSASPLLTWPFLYKSNFRMIHSNTLVTINSAAVKDSGAHWFSLRLSYFQPKLTFLTHHYPPSKKLASLTISFWNMSSTKAIFLPL